MFEIQDNFRHIQTVRYSGHLSSLHIETTKLIQNYDIYSNACKATRVRGVNLRNNVQKNCIVSVPSFFVCSKGRGFNTSIFHESVHSIVQDLEIITNTVPIRTSNTSMFKGFFWFVLQRKMVGTNDLETVQIPQTLCPFV